MPQPDAAVAYYADQKNLAAGIIRRVAGQWASVDPLALDRSWTAGRVGEQIYVLVSTGQQLAASLADPYLDAVLSEQNIDPVRVGSIRPRAFAGVASDGRSLESLLYEPVVAAKVAMKAGGTVPEAMAAGYKSLTRVASTQIADAGRTAVGSGIVARPEVTTWTRYLSPPSCSRCVVLAGKVYRWNQGFARHPRCKCSHAPTSEVFADELVTDPRKFFDSLSDVDQDKYFGAAGATAIRDGADVSQVVNARRKGGLYQANGRTFTTEGTTKRGLAGKRLPGVARPAPESIFDAATDRASAIEDLRRFGYLV